MKFAFQLHGVSVRLRHKTILDQVNLAVRPGEFWGIAGPNGAGKTSLIRLLAGFLFPSEGSVEVLGKPLEHWKLPTLRRKLGFLMQHLFFDEGIPLSAREIILMGRTGKRGLLKRFAREDYEVVEGCAAELGITSLLDRPIGSLSGGERQLVQLARALAQESEMFILDEPTSNLDPRAEANLIDIVERLHRRYARTVLVVTHEISSLPPACGFVALVKGGRLVASGPKEELLQPKVLSELYGFELRVEKRSNRYHIFRE